MLILTQKKEILKLPECAVYTVFVRDYSNTVNGKLNPEIKDENQYQVIAKIDSSLFNTSEVLLGAFSTEQNARQLGKRLFKAIRDNDYSFEV